MMYTVYGIFLRFDYTILQFLSLPEVAAFVLDKIDLNNGDPFIPYLSGTKEETLLAADALDRLRSLTLIAEVYAYAKETGVLWICSGRPITALDFGEIPAYLSRLYALVIEQRIQLSNLEFLGDTTLGETRRAQVRDYYVPRIKDAVIALQLSINEDASWKDFLLAVDDVMSSNDIFNAFSDMQQNIINKDLNYMRLFGDRGFNVWFLSYPDPLQECVDALRPHKTFFHPSTARFFSRFGPSH